MSEIQAVVERLVRPDYQMFGIGDRSDLGEPLPTPGDHWLGSGRTGFLLRVGEQMVEPNLRVEVWDGPPPELPADHEVQETIRRQFATGQLGLNLLTHGGEDLLDVAPGFYAVRVTGWNRERTRHEYATLSALHDDWDAPAFVHGCATLTGQERYLVQVWLEAPTAALIDGLNLTLSDQAPVVVISDTVIAQGTPVTSTEPAWLGRSPTAVLIELGRPYERASLRMELWDGPPPDTEDTHEVGTAALQVPSGNISVAYQGGMAAVEPAGGWLPFGHFHGMSSGDHELRLTRSGSASTDEPNGERYLAQFWPA